MWLTLLATICWTVSAAGGWLISGKCCVYACVYVCECVYLGGGGGVSCVCEKTELWVKFEIIS